MSFLSLVLLFGCLCFVIVVRSMFGFRIRRVFPNCGTDQVLGL